MLDDLINGAQYGTWSTLALKCGGVRLAYVSAARKIKYRMYGSGGILAGEKSCGAECREKYCAMAEGVAKRSWCCAALKEKFINISISI